MTTAFEFRGARFERIEHLVQIPLDDTRSFLSPRVERIAVWWRAAADQAGAMPRKSSFDIADHFVLAAYLFLAEQVAEDAFWYRLRGEFVLWMFGGAERGRAIGSYAMGAYGHDLAAYYGSVLSRGGPVICRGDIVFADGRSALFESIDCPLSDEAGQPRFILGLADIIDTAGRAS